MGPIFPKRLDALRSRVPNASRELILVKAAAAQ
jgi:hypothetical protein